MIKIGIFIIPNQRLKKIILKFKKIVQKQFGNQIYLNHLPHCSLYVFETNKKNLKKIKKIKYLKNKTNKWFITKNTGIFMDDPITKRNTYILKIIKNKFLVNLQVQVLRAFSGYSQKKKNIKFLNNKMQHNYQLFGYPFIKFNWRPHYTIASISLKKDQSDFVELFKNFKFHYKQSLRNIFVYQIKKNKHNLISKIKI